MGKQKKALQKINFQTAMDTNKIKVVTRDTVDKLFMKVIENWRRTMKTDDVSGGLRDDSRPAAGEHARATARNLGEALKEDSHDDINVDQKRRSETLMQSEASGSKGGGENDTIAAGARQETTVNAVSPSTCLLDLLKERGFDETLCERICHGLGATTLDDWSLVEDPEIDHIQKELDLKPIHIKKLKRLVEECRTIVEDQTSKAGGGGGSAETAALSRAREARIGDKRKIEGEELLNDEKTRKNVGSSSSSAHLTSSTLEYPTVDHSATLEYPAVDHSATLEYPAVDPTIWAHLEFEDGQIVPLKNSVSTSFYIGREPSTHEHYHRFYHEDDKLCRRISRAHCHILRLDTGSFSFYIFSLNCVLLILMKYVN